MMKIEPFILLLLILGSSLLLSVVASRFVDALYRKNQDLLENSPSFVPRFRRPFFAFGFLICGLLLLHKTGIHIFPFESWPPFPHDCILPWETSFLFLIPGIFLLLVITVTDLEHHLILDDTTLPLALLGGIRSAAAAFTAGTFAPLPDNLLAALGGGLVLFLLALLTRGGIGGGDIKLIAALGLWLGTLHLTHVVCSGFLLGGGAALFLLVTGRKKKKEFFAYGPCFTLSALVSLLTGLL